MPHVPNGFSGPLFVFSLLAAAVAFPESGVAGSVTHKTIPFNGVEEISIKGDIEAGDVVAFRDLSLRYKRATVDLDSNGGMLLPAIEIGKIIRIAGYNTNVGYDSTCASACALIWLAGKSRWVSDRGRVGFHASYRTINGKFEESGVANALIGNYMTLLGLPTKAVIFATLARPDQITWLSDGNKDESGIAYEVVPTVVVAPVSSAASTTPRQASTPVKPTSNFVSEYPRSLGQNLILKSKEKSDDAGVVYVARYKWANIKFSVNGDKKFLFLSAWPGSEQDGWDYFHEVKADDFYIEKFDEENLGEFFEKYFSRDPWLHFSNSGSKSVHYYNVHELSKEGDDWKIWTKADYSADKTVKWRESKELIKFSCREKIMGLLMKIDYSAGGEIVKSQNFSGFMSPIIPDSVGDDLWRALCSK